MIKYTLQTRGFNSHIFVVSREIGGLLSDQSPFIYDWVSSFYAIQLSTH